MASDVVWYNGTKPVSITVSDGHDKVVDVALDMFSSDMQAVTGHKANKKSNGTIEVYQLDRLTDKDFQKVERYGVPVSKFIAKPDAFYLANANGKIVIVGSNGRGTAYGILELSRLAGVSPWIWWGDVKPQRRNFLSLKSGFSELQSPDVRFRGIFINDEDWSLRRWSHLTLDKRQPSGSIGPRTYKKIFELLLRLRANMIWPAMHPGTTPFFLVKGNKEVADSCGIIIGSSHCEPLLRNNVGEWHKSMGEYNYATNRKRMIAYWEERLKEAAGMEAVYTIGLRGVHDGPMLGAKTRSEQRSLLQKAIHDQVKLLKQTEEKIDKRLKKKQHETPNMVFVPYKEVLDILDDGLQVPEDITLLWPDDNYGYLMRLSDKQQQQRRGGSGIYYHLSYWGAPHDYLWLCTTQPGLIWSQLDDAYKHHADRMWIANVHDPKVAAYQLSLFMDMAWNRNAVRGNDVESHLRNWLTQQFGAEIGSRALPLMQEYYHLTSIRKPEFMGWSRVEEYGSKYPKGITPVQNSSFSYYDFGSELETYLSQYLKLKKDADELSDLVPFDQKDAFFAAVGYPIAAAADMAVKQLGAQEARTISRAGTFHHDEEALEAAAASCDAYDDIKSLTARYNSMNNGKWNGLMCDTPRDLPVFDKPALPDTLSKEERVNYRMKMDLSDKVDTEDAVAMNASHGGEIQGPSETIDMLGHSMKALRLSAGTSVTYRFYSAQQDSAVLYLAFVPVHPSGKGDLRVSVSIDGGTPVTLSVQARPKAEEWKEAVLRGQMLKRIPIRLASFQANHTLTVTAIDDGVIFDQWMIDSDTNRDFYMIPIKVGSINYHRIINKK